MTMNVETYLTLPSKGRRSSASRCVAMITVAVALFSLALACRPRPETNHGDSSQAHAPARVVGIGRIEPELRIVDLAAEVAGEVVRISAQAGASLHAGVPILTLSDAVERARVAQTTARVVGQRNRIEGADAALRGATARSENAARVYARAETLFISNSGTQADLDAAQAQHLTARAEMHRLEAEARAARAELTQLEADLQLATAELDRRTVRAPGDGQLLALDVALGSFVAMGEPIGTFANESPVCARCEVDEVFASSVREGQLAFVRALGGTDSLATGSVSFAGPYLRRKSLFADEVGDLEDRRVREVTVTLDPMSSVLLGTRVECVISVQ